MTIPRSSGCLALAALVLLAAAPARAETEGDAAAGLRVDQAGRAEMAERKIPSVVIGISTWG